MLYLLEGNNNVYVGVLPTPQHNPVKLFASSLLYGTNLKGGRET